MAEGRRNSGGSGSSKGGGAGAPHFFDRLALIIKYWKAVGAVLVLVVAGMMWSAYTTIPRYSAYARLQIEDEQTTQTALNGSAVTVQDPEAFYQTQLRILQGRELASRAVRRLKLETVPEFNGTGPTPTRLSQAVEFVKAKVLSPFTGGPSVAPPPKAGDISEDDLVSAFQGYIGVEQVRDSYLVDVSFDSSDPEFAAKAVNVIAEEYVKQNLEFRMTTTQSTLTYLQSEVEKQEALVQESQRQLAEYRATQDAISLGEGSNIVSQRLTQLSDRFTDARSRRMSREVLYKQITAADPKDRAGLSAIASSLTLQNLRGQMNALERERARLQERYLPDYPDLRKVISQIADLQRQITADVDRTVETIKNDYEAALAEERSTQQELRAQETTATDLGRKSVDYSVLQREAESSNDIFQQLLQKQNELRVISSNRANNVRLLERARVPGGPYTPDLRRAWMMAIALGLGLGIAAAFLIDYLDDTIKTPDDIRWKLKLPFLGVVPKVAGNEQPLLSESVPPHFGEAFRALRTALVNASTDRDTKVICTTSSQPREGKTTTTVNMALALAIGGARVLIIDADMRRPSIHKALKMTNDKGLAELLSDQTRMRDVVRKTTHPNLVVMTAGELPPNPSELLAGDKMRTLIRQLSQSPFDWVIIDTPPVLAVTDAVILAPLVSGVTFIVGAEMTRWRMAERAIELLQSGQPKSIAAVLNRVDLDRNRYYYWRYYGHQNYGYYGEKKAAS